MIKAAKAAKAANTGQSCEYIIFKACPATAALPAPRIATKSTASQAILSQS
jgi:hypothetical protein